MKIKTSSEDFIWDSFCYFNCCLTAKEVFVLYKKQCQSKRSYKQL